MKKAYALGVFLAVGTLVVFTTSLPAQEKNGLTKSPRSQIAPFHGAVTQKEAFSALRSVETAINRVILVGNHQPAVRATGAQPATRVEIIREMHRLYDVCRPKVKYTPRKLKVDPKVLTVPAGTPERKMLERLIALGFIGRVAPLATNKQPTIELADFGDALGIFIARLAELTHTPSSKWSPYMMGHKEPQ